MPHQRRPLANTTDTYARTCDLHNDVLTQVYDLTPRGGLAVVLAAMRLLHWLAERGLVEQRRQRSLTPVAETAGDLLRIVRERCEL